MTATLPILRIKTKHSEYVIDQNVGTFSRRRREADASNLSAWGFGDDEAVPYRDVLSDLQVGGKVALTTFDGRWIRSTEILEIAEEWPASTS